MGEPKRRGQRHLYDYFIDEHGRWFCEGNPVEDRDLFRLLSRSLFERIGRYYVRCEGEVHPVRVADAPLWVRYIFVDKEASGSVRRIRILLEDGREEPLRPESLRIQGERALYCLATKRNLPARLGKVAYYELASLLRWDETGGYRLTVAGRDYPIQTLRNEESF
ncbi:hypothetical protein SAMN02746041_00611 [Desulfacinum hydrothermale DSM 13146]|uniref:DUF1285 domain-containing protein n=1 Tax=Desulfacinum hydrothermale DSM 13146 TaxID=1121390 RepID=A0A1W1X592_9BACT|nr:DUF1285 domain-containing protein [Desulfacinum hydrothermale]SMC19076.1 hypothetical protein SAMN02746041_00611 [Desulfacinum hydrothermale DSM 13146]